MVQKPLLMVAIAALAMPQISGAEAISCKNIRPGVIALSSLAGAGILIYQLQKVAQAEDRLLSESETLAKEDGDDLLGIRPEDLGEVAPGDRLVFNVERSRRNARGFFAERGDRIRFRKNADGRYQASLAPQPLIGKDRPGPTLEGSVIAEDMFLAKHPVTPRQVAGGGVDAPDMYTKYTLEGLTKDQAYAWVHQLQTEGDLIYRVELLSAASMRAFQTARKGAALASLTALIPFGVAFEEYEYHRISDSLAVRLRDHLCD